MKTVQVQADTSLLDLLIRLEDLGVGHIFHAGDHVYLYPRRGDLDVSLPDDVRAEVRRLSPVLASMTSVLPRSLSGEDGIDY